MYAGPGSASLVAAAKMWDSVASDLFSAASAFQSVVWGLTVGSWIGSSDEFIIAAGSDNSGQPESTPGAVPSSPRKEMLGSGSAPAGAKGTRDNEISEPTMETLNGVGREAGEMLGAAGGHRIDRPQTQPARLQPSTRLAAKSHACQRIPVYFPVCFQSLIRPMAKS